MHVTATEEKQEEIVFPRYHIRKGRTIEFFIRPQVVNELFFPEKNSALLQVFHLLSVNILFFSAK